METYRIWSGTRTFLPGDDSEYTVEVIVAEELGMFEDVDYDGYSGRTTYVYRTADDEVIINLVKWKSGIGEPRYGSIFRYRNLSEAISDGFEPVLRDARLI
jgi:hypothetical protein